MRELILLQLKVTIRCGIYHNFLKKILHYLIWLIILIKHLDFQTHPKKINLNQIIQCYKINQIYLNKIEMQFHNFNLDRDILFKEMKETMLILTIRMEIILKQIHKK